MSLYRVYKREEPVELHLSDQVVHHGVVFLSHIALTRSGEQTLLDLMREKATFLPFRDNMERFLLVNKSAVTHVVFRKAQESPPLGDKLQVRITFFGGEVLEGRIILDMPEDKNRLLDYVNASPGFFALEGDGERYIANGAMVREIAPSSVAFG